MKSAWLAGVAVLVLAGCGGSEGEGAIPERVVALEGDANGDLAIDGTDLFFVGGTDTGHILRTTLDGADRRTIATFDRSAIGRVAVGGDSVFVTGHSLLLSVPRAGGDPQVIGPYPSTPREPARIAADAQGVWVAAIINPLADEGDSSVDGYEAAGNSSFPAPGAHAVAIDETHVYWTTDTSVRRRLRALGSSPDDEILVEGNGSFGAVAVNETHVVWLDLASARVMAVEKDGGTPVVVASGDPRCAFTMLDELAVDDTHVYWSIAWLPDEDRDPRECKGPASILASPLSGGGVVPLSSRRETGDPRRLALGPDHVYYIDLNEHHISRVPR